MVPEKEVFHTFGREGFLLVDFVSCSRDEDTNMINKMLVSYKGEEAELLWNDYDFCYEGKVNHKKGYIL